MDLPKYEIKDRIKQALSARNMNAAELSEKSKIPKSSLSQYISGHVRPKQDRIYYLCKALDVSEAWLMGFDVPMERGFLEYAVPSSIFQKEVEKKAKEDFIFLIERHGYEVQKKQLNRILIYSNKLNRTYNLNSKDFNELEIEVNEMVDFTISRFLNKRDAIQSELNAAHETKDSTVEDKKHDDDIMDSDNF